MNPRPLLFATPGVYAGRPLFKGGGPLDSVIDRIWAGDNVEETAHDFAASVEDVYLILQAIDPRWVAGGSRKGEEYDGHWLTDENHCDGCWETWLYLPEWAKLLPPMNSALKPLTTNTL